MKVVKFGGSSVATASQIQKIIEIIKSDKLRRVVVVSAPGKRNKDDIKVEQTIKSFSEIPQVLKKLR